MADSFIKLGRVQSSLTLALTDPIAFAILSVVALRARRVPDPVRGLAVGDAWMGFTEFTGMTRQQYRSGVGRLRSMGFVTTTTTNKGTTAHLQDSAPYDINATSSTITPTNEQPTSNQPATTNKNLKKGNNRKTYTENFKIFWGVYPKSRRQGKQPAFKSWQRLEQFDHILIIEHVRKRTKADPQWTKDNGAYVPMPTTFLNQRRWEDEYTGTNNTEQQKPRFREPQVMYLPDGSIAPQKTSRPEKISVDLSRMGIRTEPQQR